MSGMSPDVCVILLYLVIYRLMDGDPADFSYSLQFYCISQSKIIKYHSLEQ